MSGENKLLTVIITVYNEEKYIAECIESITNQTYGDLEVIIVDDGSTDGSLAICSEYEKVDNRVKVISKENGGLVSARKTGMEAATGEYITYVDSDDWLDTELYKTVMDNIADADIYAYGLTCVYGDVTTSFMVNECESGVYAGDELQGLRNRALYNGASGHFGVLPSVCSKVFKKSLIENNLCNVDNSVRMGEDGCTTFPSICDAGKIIINNELCGYMYRQNIAGAMTKTYNYDEFYRIECLYNNLYAAFKRKNAEYMMDQLVYYLAFMYRNEMVYELAYLSIKNLPTKLKHLNEISHMEWVQFIFRNADFKRLDGDTELLVKCIYNRYVLMFRWYIKRLFPNSSKH